MGKSAWVGVVSAIVLALICGGIYAFTEGSHVAEATPDTILGVDTNPAGNSATSLGSINGCISVSSTGGPFYIDLIVQDVTNLNSYDGTFRFDGSLVEVTGVDVEYFLTTASGSSVSDYSGSVPNNSGSFQVSAYDYGEAPESGEGVLARLEITPRGPAGISKANFDLRPDGYDYSGVILLDETGTAIGSPDEDDYFDGSILNAEIAVGEPCPGECQPDVDTDGDGFDDDVECYLPTDQNDDCTDEIGVHDAWPLDINIDKAITVGGDVLPYRGRIGATGGPPPDPNWLQRLDVNMDNAITVGGDVLPFRGQIGETCS